MAFIAAYLNAEVMLVVSDRYMISLFPPTPNPPPPHPISPSLINLAVSVDVKHHVYLLSDSASGPLLPYTVCQLFTKCLRRLSNDCIFAYSVLSPSWLYLCVPSCIHRDCIFVYSVLCPSWLCLCVLSCVHPDYIFVYYSVSIVSVSLCTQSCVHRDCIF